MISNLPSSQLAPVTPGGHVQWLSVASFMQLPPFWQKWSPSAHSSVSHTSDTPVMKLSLQVHWKSEKREKVELTTYPVFAE